MGNDVSMRLSRYPGVAVARKEKMFVCCDCRLLSQHTNIFGVILQLKDAQDNALSECVNRIPPDNKHPAG